MKMLSRQGNVTEWWDTLDMNNNSPPIPVGLKAQ